jgi:NAD(P)-dependent dehydrogenase (short-subunit alcohol dehydrogenase family)
MKARYILLPSLAAGAGAALAARASNRGAPYSFKDRVVVITGGSRGLGLLMARQLADEGARLALFARDQEELDRAESDLSSRGVEVLAIPCDVGERAQVETAIAQVIERYGRIDVLINNAGIIQVGPVDHMRVEDFEDAMRVHLWGPLYAMTASLPHMRRQGGGRIVNISSIGGKIAVPHLLPYSVSKFALVGLSDGMRAELAGDGIQVTTVAPGLMRTGSPPNAFFKGNNKREYAWFAILDSLPVTSIDAGRAARQIIEACRRGDPDLTVTIQARMAIVASTIAPRLFARVMQIYNRLLPAPVGPDGDVAKSGWESGSRISDSPLVRPTYEAARENNEVDTSVGGTPFSMPESLSPPA